MSTIHITLTPEGDWETNVDVRNSSGNHPQHLFWSNSHLPQRTNRRKFAGTLPRLFWEAKIICPQRTPEDETRQFASKPLQLHVWRLKTPMLTLLGKKRNCFIFIETCLEFFRLTIHDHPWPNFRMEAARSTLRSEIPTFDWGFHGFFYRNSEIDVLLGWKRMMLRYTQDLHISWQDRRTIREFFTSFMHFPGFFVWNSLDRNLSCGMTSTVRRSWAEEKHVALADMTTLWFKMIAALKMDAKWILNMTKSVSVAPDAWAKRRRSHGEKCRTATIPRRWWVTADIFAAKSSDRKAVDFFVKTKKTICRFDDNCPDPVTQNLNFWTLIHQVCETCSVAPWTHLFRLCVTGCFTLPPCSANIVGAQRPPTNETEAKTRLI